MASARGVPRGVAASFAVGSLGRRLLERPDEHSLDAERNTHVYSASRACRARSHVSLGEQRKRRALEPRTRLSAVATSASSRGRGTQPSICVAFALVAFFVLPSSELGPQIHAISDETHHKIHALLTDHQKELEKAMQQREHNGEENRRSAYHGLPLQAHVVRVADLDRLLSASDAGA